MEIKKLPQSKVEFNITIPWEGWEIFLKEAVTKLSKEIKIEGFRPGKAPEKILEQKIGEEMILSTAAESAIKKNYPLKIKELNLDAIGSPEIKITKLARGNALEFSVITAVMPKATLGDWKKSVKKVNEKHAQEKIEISEESVMAELEKIAKSRAKLVTVNRAAQKDDLIILDFQVKKDGVIIEGGTAKDHSLILGTNVFIPGFEEQLIGLKEGEEKEFELTFPKEYHDENLAGKKAQFEIKLKLVQERELPKFDDAFAQGLGKFKDLADLKNNIKEGLTKEQEFQKQEKRRGDIVESLVENMQIEGDFPEILVHEELHKMLHELEAQIEQTGMKLEDYLNQMGKTRNDLEKDWTPQAQKRIKAALALEIIIKEREIVVASEEIEEAMNKTLQFYKNEKDIKDKIDMKRLYDYTNGVLRNEEAFKMLEKI